MQRLWTRMAEIYGVRWTSAYGDDAGKGAGLTWARGLSGLGADRIGQGLDIALMSGEDWPPTLPRFRAMCFGIPSIATTRDELRGQAPVSPFGRMVWARIDAYRYRIADVDRADWMLKEAYELAREAVMRGEPMPTIAGELEAPQPEERKPADPAVVKEHLDKLRSMFGSDDDDAEVAPT